MTTTCSLDQYAEAVALPVDFLAGLGLTETKRRSRAVVEVPYPDTNVSAFATAPPTDREDAFDRPINAVLYAPAAPGPAPAQAFVTEGEVDAQTLTYHGLRALARPPACTWDAEWSSLVNEVAHVCIVGRDEAPTWLDELPFRDRVSYLQLPDGATINGLHRGAGETFPQVWEAHAAEAKTWRQIDEERRQARRAANAALCGELLTAPRLLDEMDTRLKQMGFAGDTAPVKLVYLALTSRLLPRPLAVVIKGTSALGKSFVVKQALKFVPDEAYYEVTAMSDRALIYSQEPLRHRVLVLFEDGGMSDTASLMIRSLLSDGRIMYDTVIDMKPVHIDREGPTGFVTTTTAVYLHAENETRYLSYTLDDSPERIREVMLAVALDGDREPVSMTDWTALQQYVADGPLQVSMSFAATLARNIPPVSVRLQRDLAALLNLIRAHAILHQAARDRDDRGRVVATIEDYRAVHEVVHQLFLEASDAGVPASVRETVEALHTCGPAVYEDGDGVSVAHVACKLQRERSTVSRRLSRAVDLGYVVEVSDNKPGRRKRWILGDRGLESAKSEGLLPSADELADLCSRACIDTPDTAEADQRQAVDPNAEPDA